MSSAKQNIAVLDVRDEYERLITQIELSPLTAKDTIFWDKGAQEPLSDDLAQLVESSTYEYRVVDLGFQIRPLSGVISRSAFQDSSRGQGTIQTGLFVGTLPLVVETLEGTPAGTTRIEVRSRKLNYETEYRSMLEDIADWCVDLMSDLRGATANRFLPDPGSDWNTIQERFFVLSGIIDSRDFNNALHRILAFPHTLLNTQKEDADLRRGMKWTGSVARQFASSSRRVGLSADHPLRRDLGITSAPTHITVDQKRETVDTPANQFVKFALEAFEFFLTDMAMRLKSLVKDGEDPYCSARDEVLIEQVDQARKRISEFLSHALFQETSAVRSVPIGNPVLQRKAGYREVLLAWFKFQMASQLVWEGGDDVFLGGQKDVATLYEYWVFFKLLDAFKSVADVDTAYFEQLFEETSDGLSIKLKAGRMLGPIRGKAQGRDRSFFVEFSYNKSFSHSPQWNSGASWTRRLRPDYTFEIWPMALERGEAENSGVMARIHFDAKYRANISDLFGEDTDEGDGKRGQKRSYVREDLLKMHAYRDAIRRTEGAYAIFPGNEETVFYQFEELLPGLGAFALRPGLNEGGTLVIRDFLSDVIEHLSNRLAISERMSYASARILSQGKRPPVYANISECMEIGGAIGTTPPADEFQMLIVQQASNEAADWTARHKKIVVFLEAGVNSRPLLDAVNRSVVIVSRVPTEGDQTIVELIPQTYYFLPHAQLASVDYPETPGAEDIVLVVEVELPSEGLPNIPRHLLDFGFEKMTAAVSAYTLAELTDLYDGERSAGSDEQ